MAAGKKALGVAAGAVAGVVGVAAVRVAQQRRAIAHRPHDVGIPLGSLRSTPITVVADDGLPLHVEVDEFDPAAHGEQRRRRTAPEAPPVTVVFCHGYALSLDSWHFQRAGYRGLVRTVFYDHRSHGNSGRSRPENATMEQLGRDLGRVLEDVTNDEPVVLVGHSMGGMTVMSFAQQFPELIGTKVVGAALIATSAGGLDPSRILFPMLPGGFGGGLMGRAVRTLSRGGRVVDALRSASHSAAMVVTDAYAFGTDVPEAYVEFAFDLIDRTPFDVVADFYPAVERLDLYDSLDVLGKIPTSLIGGTGDKITGIGHSRKLHARIAGSDLLELPRAGHLPMLECHEEVNGELDLLLAASVDQVGQR